MKYILIFMMMLSCKQRSFSLLKDSVWVEKRSYYEEEFEFDKTHKPVDRSERDWYINYFIQKFNVKRFTRAHRSDPVLEQPILAVTFEIGKLSDDEETYNHVEDMTFKWTLDIYRSPNLIRSILVLYDLGYWEGFEKYPGSCSASVFTNDVLSVFNRKPCARYDSPFESEANLKQSALFGKTTKLKEFKKAIRFQYDTNADTILQTKIRHAEFFGGFEDEGVPKIQIGDLIVPTRTENDSLYYKQIREYEKAFEQKTQNAGQPQQPGMPPMGGSEKEWEKQINSDEERFLKGYTRNITSSEVDASVTKDLRSRFDAIDSLIKKNEKKEVNPKDGSKIPVPDPYGDELGLMTKPSNLIISTFKNEVDWFLNYSAHPPVMVGKSRHHKREILSMVEKLSQYLEKDYTVFIKKTKISPHYIKASQMFGGEL